MFDKLKKKLAADSPEAKGWQRIGYTFQVPMMALFAAQAFFFEHQSTYLSIAGTVRVAGMAMFLWCLWYLYFRFKRLDGLITTGPFRFTRHPMYFGLLLMNLGLWVPADVWSNPGFLISEALFVTTMVLAGYCQERETLARFGASAADYYQKTPRIPFFPW